MACSSTVKDKCEACYNYGGGSIGPRALDVATSDCKSHLDLTIGLCKIYIGTTVTTATVRTFADCVLCDTDFYVWNSFTNMAECTNIIKEEFINIVKELEKTSNSEKELEKKIDNCMSTAYFIAATETRGCIMCRKNFRYEF